MSDSLEGLMDELRSAHMAEYKPRVELVRVTEFGLQDSIIIVPMTDERARATGCPRGAKEALIHPEDWLAICMTTKSIDLWGSWGDRERSVVERIYGIRVVHDSSRPARFQGNGP